MRLIITRLFLCLHIPDDSGRAFRRKAATFWFASEWEGGLSARQIARSLKIARSTVAEYLRRAEEAGLTWPLPKDLDEAAIEHLLFPTQPFISHFKRPLPDWVKIHKELRHKGVTLFLLWQEYKAVYPEGFQYSRFCELSRLSPVAF